MLARLGVCVSLGSLLLLKLGPTVHTKLYLLLGSGAVCTSELQDELGCVHVGAHCTGTAC